MTGVQPCALPISSMCPATTVAAIIITAAVTPPKMKPRNPSPLRSTIVRPSSVVLIGRIRRYFGSSDVHRMCGDNARHLRGVPNCGTEWGIARAAKRQRGLPRGRPRSCSSGWPRRTPRGSVGPCGMTLAFEFGARRESKSRRNARCRLRTSEGARPNCLWENRGLDRHGEAKAMIK